MPKTSVDLRLTGVIEIEVPEHLVDWTQLDEIESYIDWKDVVNQLDAEADPI